MTPDVNAMLAALDSGAPHVFAGIDVVACRVDGTDMLFCVDREADPIQRNNRAGKFYEAPELRWIGQRVKPGATFVDIGANIGNHGLYFARKLGAACVIPIEPNPVAYRLLTANVVLNGLRDVFDLS
ncbi:MAG: FkbM family methyltransferase, partial [Pseudomonadota bacterium]